MSTNSSVNPESKPMTYRARSEAEVRQGNRGLADSLIFSADVRDVFGPRVRLDRLVESEILHRLARGQYVPKPEWEALDVTEQYRVRVIAAARSRTAPPPLSHESAAALWQLPLLGGWPREVHFLSERSSGGRSYPGIRIHAVGFEAQDVAVRDDVYVTTVERTVVDLAATLDAKSAVAVVDRALAVDRFNRFKPMTTKRELLVTWERMLPFRGAARARAYIDFGTELSASTGESGSRVNIALNGFPAPILQRTFVIDGKHYDTDFYWVENDGVGECDGKGKYLDPELLRGKTTAQVVLLEKDREDAIRRRVRSFTRWDSTLGMSRHRLRERLLETGLSPGRPRLQLR